MFRYALEAVVFLTEEKIAAKVDYLKKTFRWSYAELRVAMSKDPLFLLRRQGNL
jgi:mTERF domain-containing protein